MWNDDSNVHLGVNSVLHATHVHYTRRSINYSYESSKLITSSLISLSLNYQINYSQTRIYYLLKLISISYFPKLLQLFRTNHRACISVHYKILIMRHPIYMLFLQDDHIIHLDMLVFFQYQYNKKLILYKFKNIEICFMYKIIFLNYNC